MENVIQAPGLLSIIKESLEYKKAISIIRYGDGEAIVLNGFKDIRSFSMVLKRQLGYIPAINEAEEIRGNLISALNNADIIGIPCAERLKDRKDYWSKAEGIFNENITFKNNLRLFTNIDVHSHFLDKNYFKELMQGVEVVNYISCRNLDEEIKKAFGVKRVNSFIVAPEAKFDNTYDGLKHYPDQFNKIERWMDKAVPVDGNLCLIGAGFIGKIYCNWFRDRGGVAFDIGSVFDSWAGLATRGPARGLNSIDNTFKL
jgi:hypothetical protein